MRLLDKCAQGLFWSLECHLPGMMFSVAVMKSASFITFFCVKPCQCKASDTHNSCVLKLGSAYR